MRNNLTNKLFLIFAIALIVIGARLSYGEIGVESNTVGNNANTAVVYNTYSRGTPNFNLYASPNLLDNLESRSGSNESDKIVKESENILNSLFGRGKKSRNERTGIKNGIVEEGSGLLSGSDSKEASLSFVNLSYKVFSRKNNENAPLISARRAVVADLKSGEVYYRLGYDKLWPTASIAKLMTAATALKNDLDFNSRIIFSENDFDTFDNGLPKNLRIGDEYSAYDVLKMMLMLSNNEAAEAIANYYGRDNFINEMNSLAGKIGLSSTNFKDPTGISVSDQSSPKDLINMARFIYNNYPVIFKITKMSASAVREINSNKRQIIRNINIFSKRWYFIGGKTGYTDEAGGNLLTIFSYRDRPVIIIVLGSNDRFGETDRLFDWFRSNFTLIK